MKRYRHTLVEDKNSPQHGNWAVMDTKLDRCIGHLRNRMVADQVVNELNKMEAANAA